MTDYSACCGSAMVERANFTTLSIQCISSLLSLSRLDVLSTFLGLSTEQSALLAELRMSLCE